MSVLTAGDEFGSDETVEVGLLAVPEDPELLGGSEGERRRRGHADVDVERRRGRHAPPHAQDVAGEAARVAAYHGIGERCGALLALAAAARLSPD